jgi:hypothetical protein
VVNGATVIGLASAGTGAINAGDLVSFGANSTRYVVTSGDADVSNGGSITIGTRISTAGSGSILPGSGLVDAIPASATAITVYKMYASVTDHTSGATSEPGVGVDWQDYWAPVIGQLADNAWVTSTFYRATGGINCVFEPTSGPCHVNLGQYTEGGQEVGYIPYGAGWARGGNLWQATGPDGRAYIRPTSSGFNQQNSPPSWKSSDGTYSWGANLGTDFRSSGAFNCGHTDDPDVSDSTPSEDGLQLLWSTARKAWEWTKSLRRVFSITGTGYSRSGYTQAGLLVAEKGMCFGGWNGVSNTPNTTMGRIMMYSNRAAIPSGTVLVTGDFLFYPGATSGNAALEMVTTGATTSGAGGTGATIATLVNRP